jgi:hypothetical protein
MNLNSGFWQVSIDPLDKEKTAFSTSLGLYQFTVTPFGSITPIVNILLTSSFSVSLFPNGNLLIGCLIGRAVPVFNCGDQHVTIYPNMKLGTCESLYEQEPIKQEMCARKLISPL